MNIAVVIPSVREFPAWDKYQEQIDASSDKFEIWVCTEGENRTGIKNSNVLGTEDYDKSVKSIRKVDFAYAKIWKERQADIVITIDDDTEPSERFFKLHKTMLFSPHFASIELTNPVFGAYPRGFPFGKRTIVDSVLHQGLWLGDGDFFAAERENKQFFRPVSYGIAPACQYVTISSMNISFKPEIIPAFYQIPYRRFDDIWSGFILKKIANHLGKAVTFGVPFVIHNQAPRDDMADAKQEVRGFSTNEKIIDALNRIELTRETWLGCYDELARNMKWQFTVDMLGWLEYIQSL